MKCPHCGHEEDKVVDSRPSHDGQSVRRRRECLECKQRFTTYEYVEQLVLTVVKSDGRREAFDRNKLLHGIKLACNKRPVSKREMESLVDAIEAEINGWSRNDVESHAIGEEVMKRLRSIDEIAYVRFASVYKNFKDKEEFLEEMKRLFD